MIISEIQRIWSSGIEEGEYRTDSARLKAKFDGKTLLNLRTERPLSESYRNKVLGYAYKIYGKEIIDGLAQGESVVIPTYTGAGAAAEGMEKLLDISFNVGKYYEPPSPNRASEEPNGPITRLLEDMGVIYLKEIEERRIFPDVVPDIYDLLEHIIPNAVDAVFKRIDAGDLDKTKGVITLRVFIDREAHNFRMELSDNGIGVPLRALKLWEKGENISIKKDKKHVAFLGHKGTGMTDAFEYADRVNVSVTIETRVKNEKGRRLIHKWPLTGKIAPYNKKDIGTTFIMQYSSPSDESSVADTATSEDKAVKTPSKILNTILLFLTSILTLMLGGAIGSGSLLRDMIGLFTAVTAVVLIGLSIMKVSQFGRKHVAQAEKETQRHASIVIGVIGDISQEEIDRSPRVKTMGGAKVSKLEGNTYEEQMEDLERIRREYGAYAAGVLQADFDVEEVLADTLTKLVRAIEEEDKQRIIRDSKIMPINKDTIEGLKDTLKRIMDRVKVIMSETSDLSICNMEMENITRQIPPTQATSTTLDYLKGKDSKSQDGVLMFVDSPGQLKLVAEEYRKKIKLAKILNPKAAPIAPPVVAMTVRSYETHINDARKAEILKRMGVDDILKPENLILVPEQTKNTMSVKDLYETYKAEYFTGYKNLVIADTLYEAREPDDIPEGVIFMEYDTEATHHAYDAAIALLAHKDAKEEVSGIPGLKMDSMKGWYLFLPKIEKIDIKRIRDAIEVYNDLLQAA